MKELLEKIWFYVKVIFDSKTPIRARVMLIFSMVYFLLPLDIVPDFSLGIGQLDDLVVIPILFYIATRMVPEEVIARHKKHPKNIS